jgi:drug/metabolite transporter (DMT)-like permease
MKNNPKTQNAAWKGYILVALAATFWALAGTLAKYMMIQDISPVVLVEMRVTIGAAILAILLVFKKPQLLKIQRKDIGYMIILGVCGVASVQYAYYVAISKIHVATAILLQYTAPAFILIFAVTVQHDVLSLRKIFSLLLAFVGCFLVVGGYDVNIFEANKLGVWAGLASAVFFAFYSLYGEYGLKTYSVWTILFYCFTAAACFWWCVHPPWKIVTAHYSWQTWGFFLFLGVFSAIVPFGCYFAGMRYIRATRASITAMLEPVLGGVIAYIFLGEVMLPIQLLGAGLVLTGILLLQQKQNAIEEKAITP